MKICVLSSPPDPDDISYFPSFYFQNHELIQITPHPVRFREEIDRLIRDNVEVFVNLCNGTPDEELSGIDLVCYLEEKGVAFTGAGSKFFDPTRREMKLAANAAGIPTPNSLFVNELSDLQNLDHQMQFPMIVKPLHGYSSVGLSRDSRVEDSFALMKQVGETLLRFGGVLVEEFIEGREFTALVAEDPLDRQKPVTFAPLEFIFPSGESFKHYDLKWKEYERMAVRSVSDPELDARLRHFSANLFVMMDGNGYARCDFRMNADGEVFLLEINPNCGIFYPPGDPGSADLILQNDPEGHPRFVDLILKNALNRRQFP